MEGMNDVALLLQQTFMNVNDVERRKAEETLTLLSKDSNKFLDLLLQIIVQSASNGTFSSKFRKFMNFFQPNLTASKMQQPHILMLT